MYNFDTSNENAATAALLVYAIYRSRCGMIDQYMMNYEYERLGLQPIVRGKEFVDEEFFAITQRNAVCLFLEEGACSIHKNKPLWCKLYVCDLMWQRARMKVCKGLVSCGGKPISYVKTP